MNISKLMEDLRKDEALRLKPYDDGTGESLGKGDTIEGRITIGIGRNIEEVGITVAEAEYLLENDITGVFKDLDHNVPWWRDMPEGPQRGLANMCFNMGWPKLSTFKKTLFFLGHGDYVSAAAECLDSRWARRQVGERALRVSKLFAEGATS